MKKLFFVSMMTSLVWAGGEASAADKPKTLTFEQLKESCINPERFHSQRPPQDIKIRCYDNRMVWQPAQQKSFSMKAKRNVKVSLISDKYVVGDSESAVPHDATQGACPIFQEVNQDVMIEKKVSCETLLAHQGDLLDFCLSEIDQNLQENKDILSEKATGRVYTNCEGKLIGAQGQQLDQGQDQIQDQGQGQQQLTGAQARK